MDNNEQIDKMLKEMFYLMSDQLLDSSQLPFNMKCGLTLSNAELEHCDRSNSGKIFIAADNKYYCEFIIIAECEKCSRIIASPYLRWDAEGRQLAWVGYEFINEKILMTVN